MNVLLWEDFNPNPRLVTKCRLRGAVSVPAAHLHPKPGLAEELELLRLGKGWRHSCPGADGLLSQGKKGNTLQQGRNLLLAQVSRGMEGKASSGA